MAFDKEYYKNVLLAKIPSAKPASNGTEVNCRCFYCPDSKDLSHGHFYISIPDNEEPSLFYCQKCQSCGVVSHNTLMEWGIFDVELSTSLSKYNKKVMKLSKNNKYISDETIYNIKNTYININEWTDRKLSYINNRLGLNFAYDDIIKNKIALNLRDLLYQNNIIKYTRYEDIINQLDKYFLGFISYDNGFVNMRNLSSKNVSLHKSINKRYVNYNIFGKYNNTKRFYIIPTKIDINSPQPIKIHLAEGVMDALSIKYNLRREDNAIYASINGSGYIGMCKFFIMSLKLINAEIHIYPDADIQDRKIYYIMDQLKPFRFPIYIHRNIMDGEKDFGVRIDRIKEYIY